MLDSHSQPLMQALIAAALVLALTACSIPRTDAPEPIIGLEPCHLGAPGTSLRVAAQCGQLTVPENPDEPDGRHIDLNLAVVPALNRKPAPDPLFVLVGGPGQAATEVYALLHDAFSGINRDRDIVLVDQRGTGGSNPLRCPADDDPATGLGAIADEQVLRQVTECRDALSAAADLTQYTTPIAMDDLDRVRAALGYEQINLYGVSYGTRAALTYLRRHPDRVRSLVLDGVAPPDLPLGRDIARDAQRALDLIFARCADDGACHLAFPSLEQDFRDLGQRLTQAPVDVALDHPVTGAPTELALGDVAFGQSVRLLSYAPETVALLPLLIRSAAEGGDYARFAALALMTFDQLEGSIAGGMSNSVVCSEDAPFFSAEEGQAASDGTYLGPKPARLLRLGCEVWPRAEIPNDQRQPVASDVPVLLLSGEADPVTPPANAEHAAASLPNSRHLVAPGQGHGVVARGCLPRVVADFIDSGTAEGLDAACVDELAAAPFFVDFTGTTP